MDNFYQNRNFGRNEEKVNTNRYENLYRSTKKLLDEAIVILEEAINSQSVDTEKVTKFIEKVREKQ